MFRIPIVFALALLLAACAAPRPRAGANAGAQIDAQRSKSPAGAVYHIDSRRSELRVLVYRAGPLARLGHNHVMVNRAIGGVIERMGADGEFSFSMNIPASAFSVDDSRARAEEGADFPGEVPDDAKAGTMRNMLSSAVLDADEFAMIAVKGTGDPAQSAHGEGSLIVAVDIAIAGHAARIEVPVQLKLDDAGVSARGTFEVKQSALGLVPHSLMLGALQVQDALTVKFNIVATRE